MGGFFLLCFLFGGRSHPLMAQQEPQFTQYMFNSLVYNPGYAGSKGYLSAVALYRDQWFGWGNGGGYDGRPVTQTFSIHSPVNKRIALGANVVHDRIGAHRNTLANLNYAYRVPFGKGTLSLGLLAGAMNWRANWDELNFKDPRELDSAFDGQNPNVWLPDFGAGLYYFTPEFYVGISVPHLVHFTLREVSPAEKESIRKWASTYRHFYLTAGGAVPLDNGAIIFKPSVLIKSVGFFNEFFKQGSIVREIGAPTSFDLDMSLLFREKFWVGVSFRSAFAAFTEKATSNKRSSYDSFDIWTTFLLKNGLRIGLAYDYPLSEIKTYTSGSFELMLGYDFYKEVERVNSPRYF
ncbi:MAG: type IX secretion system membrane protein PorP/SprF [Saprospiraceae bacterium]